MKSKLSLKIFALAMLVPAPFVPWICSAFLYRPMAELDASKDGFLTTFSLIFFSAIYVISAMVVCIRAFTKEFDGQ